MGLGVHGIFMRGKSRKYVQAGIQCLRDPWTTIRGVEAMANSYRLLDLTVYGNFRIDGRPSAQWSRLKAGHSDDLSTGSR
jgi:hypothetical protein